MAKILSRLKDLRYSSRLLDPQYFWIPAALIIWSLFELTLALARATFGLLANSTDPISPSLANYGSALARATFELLENSADPVSPGLANYGSALLYIFGTVLLAVLAAKKDWSLGAIVLLAVLTTANKVRTVCDWWLGAETLPVDPLLPYVSGLVILTGLVLTLLQPVSRFWSELQGPAVFSLDGMLDSFVRNQPIVFALLLPAIAPVVLRAIWRLLRFNGGRRPTGFAVLIMIVLALIGWEIGARRPISADAGLSIPPIIRRGRSRFLVVFLHGWRGDEKTWNAFPHLLQEDPRFADSDVLVVLYPTYITRRNLTIGQTAQWITDRFEPNALQRYESIAVLAHSIGGLVARKLFLQHRQDNWKALLETGTPHLGAARYAQLLSVLGLSGSNIVRQVAPDSDFLSEVAVDWNAARRFRPETRCFTSPHDQLVAQSSATYQCDDFHQLPGYDHTEMVKPGSLDDERYIRPVTILAEYFREPVERLPLRDEHLKRVK